VTKLWINGESTEKEDYIGTGSGRSRFFGFDSETARCRLNSFRLSFCWFLTSSACRQLNETSILNFLAGQGIRGGARIVICD